MHANTAPFSLTKAPIPLLPYLLAKPSNSKLVTGLFMDVEGRKTFKTEEPPLSGHFLIFQIPLRLLAAAATLVALVLMLINKKTVDYFGFTLTAKYDLSEAFKFFVATNSIALFYAVASSLFLMMKSSSFKGKGQYFIFFLDLTIVALLMAGCAAATAVAYIAKFGNPKVGWAAACNLLGSFCNTGVVSVASSYFGFLIFYLLTAITMKGPRQVPVAAI